MRWLNLCLLQIVMTEGICRPASAPLPGKCPHSLSAEVTCLGVILVDITCIVPKTRKGGSCLVTTFSYLFLLKTIFYLKYILKHICNNFILLTQIFSFFWLLSSLYSSVILFYMVGIMCFNIWQKDIPIVIMSSLL